MRINALPMMKISSQWSSMSELAILLLLVTFLAACATTPMAPTAAVSDLAPTGKLRAAINFGNSILAARDTSTGEARSHSVT